MASFRFLVLLVPSLAPLLLRTLLTEAFMVATPLGRPSFQNFLPFSREFRISSTNDDEDEEKDIFFDDFGDALIGGSSSEGGGITRQLKERIQGFQQEAVRRDTQLAKNWKTGNWKVRGFSLDKTDALSGDNAEQFSTPIHVSFIVRDPASPDRIAVARTDGSVCFVRLGTEYLAKFVSKLTATTSEDDSDSIKVSSHLVRQEETEEYPTPDRKEQDEERAALESQETPFEVIDQFSAHESTLSALLMEDDMIFTAGETSSEIMVWAVPDNDDENVAPLRTLANAHDGPVVALKTVAMNPEEDPNLLLSAAKDGTFAIWDIATGDLVFKCQMLGDNGESDVSITCADVEKNILFLGLSTGHVVGYVVNEVIESASIGNACPIPSCRFLAHDEIEVSAIRCSGEGTLGRSRPGTESSILLTGAANGDVKQWEILSRQASDEQYITKLEHWPRLANQRMQRRAHMFQGHADSPITALQAIDGAKFLSAGSDGTVRVWSPTSGKELFRMDGFSEPVTSLCLDQDMLITNGMDAFVCVHDFDVTESEVEDGYELEW